MIGVLWFQLLWSGDSTFAIEKTSQLTLLRCQMITFTYYWYFNKTDEKVFCYFVKLVEQTWYRLHYFITLVVLYVFTVGLCRRSSASDDLDEKGWRWVYAWAKLGRRCDRAEIVRKGWPNCLHRADFYTGLKSHLQETFFVFGLQASQWAVTFYSLLFFTSSWHAWSSRTLCNAKMLGTLVWDILGLKRN